MQIIISEKNSEMLSFTYVYKFCYKNLFSHTQ